jgi:hypothetical protein
VSTLPDPIQHIPGIPSQSNKARREIKGIKIGREIVKISLLADDMILYLKDPKNSTPKLLDTLNTFSNVAGYEINLQKQVAFLYNNEQIEKVHRQMAWEDLDQVSLVVLWYSHRQAWARAA